MSQESNVLLVGNGHLGGFITKLLGKIHYTKRTRGDNESLLFDLDHTVKFTYPDSIETIIWTIPPHPNTENALEVLKNKNLIFISSTGVFTNGKVTNQSVPDSDSKNGVLLSRAEKFIEDNFKRFVIIRPGGLVDNLRHPKNFFKTSKNIKNSNHPINLVHTEDVARFVIHLCKQSFYKEKYNLVANPNQITKKQFYSSFDLKNEFTYQDTEVPAKEIDMEWLRDAKFQLKYPDIYKHFTN
ncbi:MAG: hypothetical protein CME61_07380 [Halobacteriovoraceae bacterium]|nr:hypothetical protein [Halobacteriovoraceae bacterium]|tara:strand:+ start:103 stop:825 length:723 start_codon:yes stop_codon:yes gene_type:complete